MTGRHDPVLSIVVPTLNEQHNLPFLLDDLQRLRSPHQVIISDGESTDETRRVAAEFGAQVVTAPPGRGTQLRAGAAAARGNVFCFLHADVRLDEAARAALERIATNCPDGVAHAFALRIAADGWPYRVVEWGAHLRSQWAGLPYGDQGLILSRATYLRAGGFPPLRVMEDVAFVRRLRRSTRLVTLPERITVSARRWETDGVFNRTACNWMLLLAYSAGVGATSLAEAYPPNSEVRDVREGERKHTASLGATTLRHFRHDNFTL